MKRWAVLASNKFKIIELVPPIQSIQNGRPQTSKRITKKSRFFGIIIPEGCII